MISSKSCINDDLVCQLYINQELQTDLHTNMAIRNMDVISDYSWIIGSDMGHVMSAMLQPCWKLNVVFISGPLQLRGSGLDSFR